MKAAMPALNEEGPQRRLSNQDDPLLVLERRTESGDERALILVNTQESESREVVLDALLSPAGLYRGDWLSLTRCCRARRAPAPDRSPGAARGAGLAGAAALRSAGRDRPLDRPGRDPGIGRNGGRTRAS